MLAAIGDGGDTLQFTDYIAKHLQLYKINHGYHLSPRAAAHFTRKNLADYIRTNTRYQVSMLMAGYDEVEGPDLHYIDSFGAAQSINHAGHGLGSLFCGSIFLMNFIVAIISLATVVKFMMYIRQLNNVKEIEKVLVKLDKRVETVKELEMHKSMTKELRLLSIMFILAYTGNAVIAESSFLFQDKRTLPFPTWFPLDWKNSMSYYLLALLYQFMSITAQISQNFVNDLFPPLVLCLIARNCEMLIHRISLIGYDQSDQRANEQRLYSCIRDQQQLYR